MFLDPNEPDNMANLPVDPTGDPNSPVTDQRKLMLGILSGRPGGLTLAGAAGPNAFQLPMDTTPTSSGSLMPAPSAAEGGASHIDQLMNSGLLTPTQGGQPVGPPPGSAPVAPAATPRPPMVDRIHDWLQSKLGPNIPAGYQGLLQEAGVTPEELDQAKPGLGSNLWHTLVSGGTGENMRNRLNELIGLHQATMQMGGQQAAVQEAARQRAALADMSNQFPPLPVNATNEDRAARMQDMMIYSASHGLPDLAKEFGASARAIWAQPKAPAPEQTLISGVKGDPNGKYPGQQVDQIVDKTKRPGDPGYIVYEVPKAAAAVDPNVLEIRRQAEQDRQTNHQDTITGQQAARFTTQNKPLVDTAPKYAAFLNALGQAKQGNQAALQTTLYGFVSNTDLNAQMRQGILKQLEQIVPGIGAMTEAKFTQALQGRLTPSMIANMEAIVLPLHRTLKALYKQRYDAAVGRNGDLKDQLATPEELFDIPGAAPTAAAPTGTRSGRDLLNAAKR